MSSRTLIPIYTTKGDAAAFLAYPYIFNPSGEWIGWVTAERNVFSVHGQYVGWLTGDPRILRRRAEGFGENFRTPPADPGRIMVPVQVPLAPLMPELSFGILDVLQEDPDLLPTIDFGEERQDMD